MKNNKKGFTLVETLMAVLLLGFVTLIIAGGMTLATESYTKVTDTANAEMLLSNTVTLMRDELYMVSEVKQVNGQWAFRESELDSWKRFNPTRPDPAEGDDVDIPDTAQGIYLVSYKGLDTAKEKDALLVTNAAAAKNLKATYTSIEYRKTDNAFIIKNLRVLHANDDDGAAPLAAEEKIIIKAFNDIEEIKAE